MTDKINHLLLDLVGLPFTSTTRAADIECFKFGTIHRIDKAGKAYNVGAFALHLQCPWRLTDEHEILVGHSDLYQQADETADYDENYDYYKVNANLRDIKLRKLIKDKPMTILSAKADAYGGLEICFDHHVVLTVFPDLSSKVEHEHWRLIDFRNEASKHLESWTTGYEITE